MAYESKARTTKIVATSRAAVKIRDNFYTVEASEERTLPDTDNVDVKAEWDILWNDLNAIVDNQVEDIVKTFNKR